MRLRIFGIPRLALFFAGMFPSLTWCAFHPLSVVYRREDFFWVCGIGILTGILLSTFIRRGFFLSRYFVYLLFITGIAVALIGAVLDRDFVSLGIALLAFSMFMGVVMWLEKKILSSALNPGHVWYEGDPRVIPNLNATLRSGDQVVSARVRRLDPGGFFLLLDQSFSFRPHQRVMVELASGSRKVEGEAKISAHFRGEKMGLGLQFLPKDLYHFTDYSALVQELRGRGL
jgi:hypothetical protein